MSFFCLGSTSLFSFLLCFLLSYCPCLLYSQATCVAGEVITSLIPPEILASVLGGPLCCVVLHPSQVTILTFFPQVFCTFLKFLTLLLHSFISFFLWIDLRLLQNGNFPLSYFFHSSISLCLPGVSSSPFFLKGGTFQA